MSRFEDLNEFYKILSSLRSKIGYRYLSSCNGNDGWPKRGVYYFFEKGETRTNSAELRVVRVGTHALKAGSTSTFWGRLREHQGYVQGSKSGGGNHRGSIFRKHIGSSIINKEKLHNKYPYWETDSDIDNETRNAELEMERRVSEYIRAMPFLWITVDDVSASDSKRGIIERNSIALLSNYGSGEQLDPQSTNWLGRSSVNEKIRISGLWNVNHVDEDYGSFLHLLEEQITNTY
jgi:hypothetical protein